MLCTGQALSHEKFPHDVQRCDSQCIALPVRSERQVAAFRHSQTRAERLGLVGSLARP
jgi:hypothetical protein